MPGPYFTTNDSEFSRLEGLYIKEIAPPAVISGAFLGIVCVVAQAIRGPVDRAIECGSPARVLEVFGGRDQGSGGAIGSKLYQALMNKPFGKLLVVRAAAAAAATATKNLDDTGGAGGTTIATVSATSPGAWGNNVSIAVTAPTDGTVGKFDLVVTYLTNTVRYKNLDFTGSNDNSLTVLGSDDGNLVTLTKVANGTPNFTDYPLASDGISGSVALASGSDGSLADTDFTATGRALEVAAQAKDSAGIGAGVVFVAERSNSTIKTKLASLASAAYDRVFLCCPDNGTVGVSSVAADVPTTRSDRLIYCFNHPYTIDPATATEVQTDPCSWMASVLSQIDIDIHPGEEDTKPILAGITRLTFENLSREDYVTLKNDGVAALEKNDGFQFVSGVTTSKTSGKEEITRRRMTDFLQLSLANALKNQVKKKNTMSRRQAIKALVDGFLGDLKKAERVVLDYLVDSESLNTDAKRALGQEYLLVKVKLIGHILSLILETQIGTSVVITER